MDAQSSPHPNAETLRAYALGQLDAAAVQTVREHLEHCTDCRQRVAQMPPERYAGRHPEAEEGLDSPSSDQVLSSGPQTKPPGAAGVTVDTSPGPCMSTTGQVDATSDAQDGPIEAPHQTGTLIGYFGDYELQNVLGEGGMGIVYKARQLSLNRPVALKMIKAARFASADDVRRFQNESEAVARLDHPNIVPIFEVGQFQDQHYFSMKLIAGESLDKRPRDYLAKPRQAAELVAVAASAIHHAHQRGILHRDLKPANILIDSNGQPHVTDFGVAKRVEGDSELTRSGAILGTPAYMAPEQASGKRGAVTTATDVYGLGAVLYVLLTGRAPFGGDSVIDTLEQVRETPPEPPRKRNARVPRDLEVVCLKCLEKDPRRRYASADALSEDLKRLLAGEPIMARPVSNAIRLWMWCRRNPMITAAAGVLTASVLLLVVLSLLYARQQSHLATARKLYADQQTDRANEQAEATTKITGLAKSLEKEGQNLRKSLSDTNRRLAMLFFERAQRAFDTGQVGHGLLWLVESWRYASEAGDHEWQHLARANISHWSYECHVIIGVFSHSAVIDQVSLSPDGKTVLIRGGHSPPSLWDVSTGRAIGRSNLPEDSLRTIAYSSDGKTVLTGRGDTTASLLEAPTGRPMGRPMSHQGHVTGGALCPFTKVVLTWTVDGTAQMWNASTGLPVGRPMAHHGRIISVEFGPDGKSLLTQDRLNTARLWDAATGQPIGKPLGDLAAGSIALFSPDGKVVFTASCDNAARLWDASTGLPIGNPMDHADIVSSAAFSPDGKTILTGSFDMSARLWDSTTGRPVGPRLEQSISMNARAETFVSFSPDGKTVAIRHAQFKYVRLADAFTGLFIGKPLEHQGAVYAVVFSPDGKTIATCSGDGTARHWDAATGLPLGHPMWHEHAVSAVAFSLDGKAIVTASEDSARLWKVTTGLPIGQPLGILDRDGYAWTAFNPDGSTFLTIGAGTANSARLWNAASGQPIGQPMLHEGRVTAATFSQDGRKVLTGSSDSTARLWNAGTGRPISEPMLHEPWVGIDSVAFSRDGKTVITASDWNDGPQLWDAATGWPTHDIPGNYSLGSVRVAFSANAKTILAFSNVLRLEGSSARQRVDSPTESHGPVLSAALSPDGERIATGFADGTARLWDAATGQPLGTPFLHQELVRSLAFSRDGKRIITIGASMIRVWDCATGRPIGERIVHRDHDQSVAISPDGRTILAGISDHGARLWDAATGQPIGPTLETDGLLVSRVFSPDGKTIATTSYVDSAAKGQAQGITRLWHLPPLVVEDLPRIKLWVETMTGLAVDGEGKITALVKEALAGSPHTAV